MTTINASFDIADWDEHAFDVHAGTAKLTRAKVAKTYTGDLTGSSTTEWLMAYEADGNATFVGLERIDATVAGRSGTLVLRHVGAFADGAATADLTVVAGAGSGDLAATTGTGHFRADPAGKVTLELTFA
jgi:hypothetical protein